jgi:hypothetical protein|uniref:Putative polysaccharide deacetylase n=1 Tax=CrAss-like virus sp. ctUXy6 TaxID=2825835 RepID=A0A8S5V7E3_9CAUD|nr:MAG TPA: putative polysaccharide deacetylase [CrAss-like virus sp. ctUXy6]
MDGINISQPIVNNAADSEYNLLPNIDAKYGPYSSTTEALMALAPNARAIGLTVGIKTSTGITEYWFKNGIGDHYLTVKGEVPDLSNYYTKKQVDDKFTSTNNKVTKNANDIQEVKETIADMEMGNSSPYTKGQMRKIRVKITGVPSGTYAVAIPPLKYDTENVVSFTTDDCNTTTLSVVWAAINKRPISIHTVDGGAGSWMYHANQYLAGDLPDVVYKTFDDYLTYTTMFGKERLKQGVAIWPYAGNKDGAFMDRTIAVDKTATNQYRFMVPYLVWEDVNLIAKYGVDFYYHNIGTEKFGTDKDIYNVIQGLTGDMYRTKAMANRLMKVIARPDGNNVFMTAMEDMPRIDVSVAENSPAVDCKPYVDDDWWHKVWSRIFSDDIDGNLKSKLTALFGETNTANKTWFHFCCHTAVGSTWGEFLKYISQTYGAISNKMWFATVGEIYEYKYMKQYAKISNIQTGGTTLQFDVEMSFKENFNYKDLTFKLTGVNVTSTSGMTIEAYDVNDESYICPIQQVGVRDNVLYCQIGCEDTLVSNIEYFVSKYEETEDTIWKDDAELDMPKLDSARRAAFQARINAISAAVKITTITAQSETLYLTDDSSTQIKFTCFPLDNTEMSKLKYEFSSGLNIEAVSSIADNILTLTCTNKSTNPGTASGTLRVYVENGASSDSIPVEVVINDIAITNMSADKSHLELTEMNEGTVEVTVYPSNNSQMNTISASLTGDLPSRITLTEKVVGNKITYTLVGKETLAGTYNGNLVVKSSITSVNTVTVPVVLTVASAVEISSCTIDCASTVEVNKPLHVTVTASPANNTRMSTLGDNTVGGTVTNIVKTNNILEYDITFDSAGAKTIVVTETLSGGEWTKDITVTEAAGADDDKLICMTTVSFADVGSLTKYEDATYGGFCNILQGEATQYVPDTDTLKAKSGLLLSGFTRKQADVQNYVEGLGYEYIKISSPSGQSGDLSSMFTIPPLYSYINKYNVAGASAFRFNVPNGNYQVRFISSTIETTDSYQNGDILLNGTSIKSQLPTAPYVQKNEWTEWFDVTVTDNVITLLISVEKSKRIGLNVIEIKIMN